MSDSKIFVTNLSLTKILSPNVTFKMPRFQRMYGWDGEKGKKAKEYFDQFLILPEKNGYCGSLFLFGTNEWNTNAPITFYVADGQHRLTTLVMWGIALDSLINNEEQRFRQDLKRDNNKGLELLNFLKNFKVEAVLDTNGKTAFVAESIESYKKCEEKLQSTTNREEKKELNLKLKKIQKDNLIVKTYLMLLEHLTTEIQPINKRLTVIKFLEKLKKFSFGTTILIPEDNSANLSTITGEAYELFNSINNQAEPLSVEEIFTCEVNFRKSIISAPCSETLDYPDIGLKGFPDFLDFLLKWNSIYTTKEAMTWVSNLTTLPAHTTDPTLYDKEKEAHQKCELIKKNFLLANSFNTLEKEVVKWVMGDNISAAHLVFITHCLDRNQDIKRLLRYLILLKIMITYIPPSGSRPNIGRDLKNYKSLDECLIYLMNHFNVTSINDFKKLLTNHIQKFQFGAKKHVKLAKLLLILSAWKERGIDIHANILNQDKYSYEHVLAQNSQNTHGVPANFIHMLGNGALLNLIENISLQDKSPKEKYESTDVSAWLPPNWKDLSENASNWDTDYIEKRSAIMASSIVEWIFI